MKNKLSIDYIVFVSVKALIVIIMLFGYSFTKFNIGSGIYLYDAILVSLCMFSFIGMKMIFLDRGVFILILIGFLYLLFSLKFNDGFIYVIRQYMIIGYLTLIYFLFQRISHKTDDLVYFLLKISKIGFYIQLVYSLFRLFSKNNLFDDFNYFSPIVVMLIPIYSARILIYESSVTKKTLKLLLVLIVSTTIGHSSAFLAVLFTVFGFFILRITPKQFLIVLAIVFTMVLSLYFFLPQFQDVNATWRLYYWGIGIQNTINTFALLGNGFGQPFINDEQINELVSIFGNSNDFLNGIDERYFKAYHNSFITMFFHMGIFILLLFKPYIRGIGRLIFGEKNKELNFMIIGLLGISVWVSFNVILELPHSSLLFWLVFLSVSKMLKRNEAV